MRRTVAVFCWLVVFPFTASALGLGEISLNSALNQPFAAEIPVDSYVESDLKGLKVALASKATFDRYGLDLPNFLQEFEFSVAKTDAGRPVVRISSLRPVSEPFVTLLLDIRWASGRLLREYTVLLDPPLFESEPVPSTVATPVVTPAAEVTQVDNTAGAVTRSPAPEPAPVQRSEPAPVASPEPPPGASAAPAQLSSQVSSQVSLSGSTYAVQRRDTLWGIASRVRGNSDLTMNQVMLALYRANPEAFLGNINRLKAGAILRVPDDSQLAQITPGDATAAVREQNQALRQPTRAVEPPEPARLTLVAPADDATTERAATGQPGASAEETAVTSDSAAGRLTAEQLQGRIGELESELSESKRLIDARDAELAALQRRLQVLESRQADAVADDPAGAPSSADTLAVEPSGELLAEDDVLVDTGTATEDPLFADEAPGEVGADAASAGDTPASDADQAATDPVAVVPARETESSFFGDLVGNLWFWISAAVVLILALFVARRRKTDLDDDLDADATGGGWETAAADADHEETMRDLETLDRPDDSILVEESSAEADAQADASTDHTDSLLDGLSDGADQTARLAPVDDAADKETPLESTISTGPLNLDQADPVAEAEFHMAYGLYDQAAELLESALQSEPDNRGYLVKLIEVFFVWENRDGFLKHATKLYESISDDSDSDWNKVLILGKQLCPDEAIFSGSAAAAPTAASMDFEISDTGDTELDFTLGGNDVPALSEDALAPGDDADGVADADLDFDLGADFDDDPDDLALNLGDGDDDVDDVLNIGADDTLESPSVADDEPATAVDSDGDTLETPTIESPAVDHDGASADSEAEPGDAAELDLDLGEELIDDSASTMETPTIESAMNDPTLESPTLESAGADGGTTEMPALDADAFGTEDVDLDLGGTEDLDVDLSGLADIDAGDDDTAEMPTSLSDDDSEEDEPTLLAEVRDLSEEDMSDDDETLLADSSELEDKIEAELNAQAEAGGSDTVEQPQIDAADVELGDTAEQPAIMESGDVDFDLGAEADADADDDVATAIQEASLPEDATMTEVGTKLDLARAYIDMGDPDGARSILNEVLDEGADEQQQEARQLLEELGD